MRTKEQSNLAKDSFTLLETIFSFIIISILIGGFFGFLNTNLFISLYNELQKAQNNWATTNTITTYKGFTLKKQ